MAFIRSEEYFARKIQNIDNAISGTRAAMENLEHDFQIEAHRSYLASLESSKAKAIAEYQNWKTKR